MSGIFLLISALLPIVTSTLQNYKVISPAIGSLINGIEGAASAATSALTSSTGTPSITATSLLAAINAALAVLQTQTTINPTDLLIIKAFDTAIQAGLAASQITEVDPTKLQPIEPV